MISPAFAQTAAAPAGSSGAAAFLQFVPLLFIFVIFYFLLIRPQQQRAKAHQAMVTALKRGDTVVLANGIDELHAMIAQWRSEHGPLVIFPPSDSMLESWLGRHYAQVETVPRGRDFSMPVLPGPATLPRG